MAARRTRGMTGGAELSKTTAARAAAVAEQLHYECSILLELYRKKEKFSADVTEARLVSVPPPSSLLDTRDKLWRLHSALLQCRSLLERAIAKEEEELGDGITGDYENQRKMVKDRLALLLINIGELFRAADSSGTILTSSVEGLELNGPTTLFEVKVWVYRIFKEVDYWTTTAVPTLQGLPTVITKERVRTVRATNRRRARR